MPAPPPQVSATSHTPAEARHTVPVGTTASAGHAAALPVQVSAMSHAPVAARHTVPAATKTSAGHAALEPVQASAESHTPAEARHTVPVATKPLAGHAAPVPAQLSATSQTPPEARHTVPAATLAQLVGPDAVAEVTVHTWQLLAGLSAPFVKHAPLMRQKPSSTEPSQSLSMPSQISVAGAPAIAVQVVAVPVLLHTKVPVAAQAPTPVEHAEPSAPPVVPVDAPVQVSSCWKQ
jgi:hypothetical protein